MNYPALVEKGYQLADQLARIESLIPADLRPRVAKMRSDLGYRAPELFNESLAETQERLFRLLQVPFKPPMSIGVGEEWKVAVLLLWTKKSVAQMNDEGLFVWECADRSMDVAERLLDESSKESIR